MADSGRFCNSIYPQGKWTGNAWFQQPENFYNCMKNLEKRRHIFDRMYLDIRFVEILIGPNFAFDKLAVAKSEFVKLIIWLFNY